MLENQKVGFEKMKVSEISPDRAVNNIHCSLTPRSTSVLSRAHGDFINTSLLLLLYLQDT
jgi:hypothetical protein